MSRNEPPVVTLVIDADRRHHSFITTWADAVRSHRGGEALLREVAPEGIAVYLASPSAVTETYFIEVETAVVGFVLVRDGVLLAMSLQPDYRRQGIGTRALTALAERGVDVIDAYALPGDRGTKSLFESIGWKARLLTMRKT